MRTTTDELLKALRCSLKVKLEGTECDKCPYRHLEEVNPKYGVLPDIEIDGKQYWDGCDCDGMIEDAIELIEKLTADQEDAKADICSNYCKHPDTWDEEKEGCELCESELCYNCPLGRIGG